jgi:hypothetical protein
VGVVDCVDENRSLQFLEILSSVALKREERKYERGRDGIPYALRVMTLTAGGRLLIPASSAAFAEMNPGDPIAIAPTRHRSTTDWSVQLFTPWQFAPQTYLGTKAQRQLREDGHHYNWPDDAHGRYLYEELSRFDRERDERRFAMIEPYISELHKLLQDHPPNYEYVRQEITIHLAPVADAAKGIKRVSVAAFKALVIALTAVVYNLVSSAIWHRWATEILRFLDRYF